MNFFFIRITLKIFLIEEEIFNVPLWAISVPPIFLQSSNAMLIDWGLFWRSSLSQRHRRSNEEWITNRVISVAFFTFTFVVTAPALWTNALSKNFSFARLYYTPCRRFQFHFAFKTFELSLRIISFIPY